MNTTKTVSPPPRNSKTKVGEPNLDPLTGEQRWEYKMVDFTDAGILTTASDLLFSGGREGDFYALDARTGALLWRFAVGGHVQSGPITYAVGGRQYVAFSAGASWGTGSDPVWRNAFHRTPSETKDQGYYVFALPAARR